MSRNWDELIIWQESHNLVQEIYKLTKNFPKEELYNLTSQIRRAVTSIPTNIVEGHSKGSSKEFIRFLYISRGSLEEVKYLLLLSKDLGYITIEEYTELNERLSKLSLQLNNFIRYLQKTNN